MMGNTQPRVSNFQGFDLMTAESDANPLIASYIGAPYQVRATDPASYGRAAADYLQGGGAVGAAIDLGVNAATHSVGISEGWDKIKTGFWGALLGVAVVLIGVAYIVFGRD
jgi:hypothetical protein